MVWTHFNDMHSGGGLKLKWKYIFIEAPQSEAVIIFQNRFGRNPNKITCGCCGSDYSISEDTNLKVASGFERGCDSLETPTNEKGLYLNDEEDLAKVYGKEAARYFKEHYYLDDGEEPKHGFKREEKHYKPHEFQLLKDFKRRKEVFIIPKEKIKAEEKEGELKEEGWIWAG